MGKLGNGKRGKRANGTWGNEELWNGKTTGGKNGMGK